MKEKQYVFISHRKKNKIRQYFLWNHIWFSFHFLRLSSIVCAGVWVFVCGRKRCKSNLSLFAVVVWIEIRMFFSQMKYDSIFCPSHSKLFFKSIHLKKPFSFKSSKSCRIDFHYHFKLFLGLLFWKKSFCLVSVITLSLCF